MKLEWSAFAFDDRDEIFSYIEQDNQRAAVLVDSRVSAQVLRPMQFPESGRPGRVDGTRELVIDHTPYIAAYRIVDDTVHILRLLHGARQWPEEMPD